MSIPDDRRCLLDSKNVSYFTTVIVVVVVGRSLSSRNYPSCPSIAIKTRFFQSPLLSIPSQKPLAHFPGLFFFLLIASQTVFSISQARHDRRTCQYAVVHKHLTVINPNVTGRRPLFPNPKRNRKGVFFLFPTFSTITSKNIVIRMLQCSEQTTRWEAYIFNIPNLNFQFQRPSGQAFQDHTLLSLNCGRTCSGQVENAYRQVFHGGVAHQHQPCLIERLRVFCAIDNARARALRSWPPHGFFFFLLRLTVAVRPPSFIFAFILPLDISRVRAR